jgi:hypothetical protein
MRPRLPLELTAALQLRQRIEHLTAVGDQGAPAQHRLQLNKSSARQRLLLTSTFGL